MNGFLREIPRCIHAAEQHRISHQLSINERLAILQSSKNMIACCACARGSGIVMVKDMILPESHDMRASTWQSTPRASAMTWGEAHERALVFMCCKLLDASVTVMSGLGPPPSQWQLDSPTPGRALAKSDALALAGKVDEVSNAWKNVKGITDGGKGVDLYDLLSQSVRDTQYSLQHPGVSHH